MPDPQAGELVRAAAGKASARLLPFLLLMYVLAFLDRANVGFAKEALQVDAGIGASPYAFGASVFFIGYAILEVPSNLILHRVGAKLWLSRIMVTWGLVSASMMFIDSAQTFYLMRFLLGAAEAGFFPGVILYITRWFPGVHRPRQLGLFYLGAPIAFIVGGPLSGGLMELDGVADLAGWRWMFLIEGLLTALVGVWAYFRLDNGPADAAWLGEPEKQALVAALAEEDLEKQAHGPRTVLAALSNPYVLYLCAIYFIIQLSVYGVTFFLPSQVAGLMGRRIGFEVGLVTAIPWIAAMAAAILVPRQAVVVGRPNLAAAALLLAAALGMGASGLAGSPLPGLAALCVAAAGFIAVQPVFWTFPAKFITGAAAAGAIAMINAAGALGGFVAPNTRTWAETTWGSPAAGLLVLCVAALAGAVLALFADRRPR